MALAPRIPRATPGRSQVKADARKERVAKPHMDMVRGLQICAATNQRGPVDVHHLMRGVTRGMGMKAAGRYVVPLAHDVHMEVTATGNPEAALMERYGLDARSLADALWRYQGDERKMFRAVWRHFAAARARRGD